MLSSVRFATRLFESGRAKIRTVFFSFGSREWLHRLIRLATMSAKGCPRECEPPGCQKIFRFILTTVSGIVSRRHAKQTATFGGRRTFQRFLICRRDELHERR